MSLTTTQLPQRSGGTITTHPTYPFHLDQKSRDFMYARGFFTLFPHLRKCFNGNTPNVATDGWMDVCLFGMAVTSLFVPILEFSLTESFVRMDNLMVPKRRTFF